MRFRRATTTTPVSSGSRNASSALRGNSGSSSRNNTPRCERDNSPGRNAPPPEPATPDRLRALAGVYINRDPWDGYAVVLARGETLVGEGFGQIVDRGGYWSLDKDSGGIERFRFDAMLNGKARRLNVSGTDFERLGV